ncbi:MAG: cytochrome C [Opitutaceae bacterium]
MAKKPLFTAASTGWFRLGLLVSVAFLAFAGYAVYAYYHSPWWTNQGWQFGQPVLFSHRHHAGELRIDCRFCHSTVENSAFAGMPSTQTCLVCHSQIFSQTAMLRPVIESAETGRPLHWARVNWVPDFVYFNHSLHIAKGVGCTTCHGQVGDFALEEQAHSFDMTWCLNCHRNPAPHLRPRSEIFAARWTPPPDRLEVGRKLLVAYDIHTAHLTDCVTCHR